mgnify:CR=1 FL=1
MPTDSHILGISMLISAAYSHNSRFSLYLTSLFGRITDSGNILGGMFLEFVYDSFESVRTSVVVVID